MAQDDVLDERRRLLEIKKGFESVNNVYDAMSSTIDLQGSSFEALNDSVSQTRRDHRLAKANIHSLSDEFVAVTPEARALVLLLILLVFLGLPFIY